MKFGGTSVGSAERIRGVVERVRERLSLRPVVVVSALSGVTDLLIRGAGLALERKPGPDEIVEQLKTRHREAATELTTAGDARQALFAHIDAVLAELSAFFVGVHNLGELTPALAGRHLGHGRASLARDRGGGDERSRPARAGRGRARPRSSPTTPSAARCRWPARPSPACGRSCFRW